LNDYKTDFEEFGPLRFSDLKSPNPEGGRPTRVYNLNEEQATLLITYLKNTSVVRKFKIDLVRQFFLMKNELMKRQYERTALKPIRREMTDVIKEVDASVWAYKKYTDLAYKLITGKTAKTLRAERGAPQKAKAIEYMTADEIHRIGELQYKIAVLLEMGMEYAEIKAALVNRMALAKAG
jgi:phage regulator Rha-like protein